MENKAEINLELRVVCDMDQMKFSVPRSQRVRNPVQYDTQEIKNAITKYSSTYQLWILYI